MESLASGISAQHIVPLHFSKALARIRKGGQGSPGTDSMSRGTTNSGVMTLWPTTTRPGKIEKLEIETSYARLWGRGKTYG